MQTRFSTSINIIRDKGKDFNYIPTPNSIRVVNQIADDFKKGNRSFNIIGSYGTGKSAFLWAFQQSLTSENKYFGINLIPNPKFHFINIVGEFKSIIETFAELFNVTSQNHVTENIFSEIYNKYYELGKTNPLLIIIIDEFGKFLEFASQNIPEKELYFIQQLSEFVNNTDLNIVLLTTVHQNFDAYALALSQSQKQEWSKVKGRFKEITFNEPVEQLLFLASEHISERPSTKKHRKEIRNAIELLLKSKAFSVNEDYINKIASNLFPLDVISANILTLSLQKYGQNERSLFSFLESLDHTGLFQHIQTKEGFYSIAEVYDYLIFNYFSHLNSRYNPDFGAWKSIKTALEKTENLFETNFISYSKLIKTIGLLSINAQSGAVLDKNFIVNYAEICLSIKDASVLIEDLEKKKVILFRNYSNRFVLFEGTDLDIQSALIEAGGKVDTVTDVVTLLNRYYNLPPVIAKKVMYDTGTPRLFEYKISSEPINEIPSGETDGYINLIFNEKDILKSVISHSENNNEAVLYCYYKNSKSIKELLFEIEKTKRVINENLDDKIAVRELNNIVTHQQNLLTHKILNNFYGTNSEVVWIFNGSVINVRSKKEFNSQLSLICNRVYSKTPIFNNELVNKHKISTSIHTAKRNYFKALVNNWDKPQLGFASEKFPPEKTIYLTLLENNGIKLFSEDISEENIPGSQNRFNHLWILSQTFLDSAKSSHRKLSEFVTLLNQKPFKIKQGLIDFWIPTYLFIKRDDFALFGKNGYIPFINDEVLDLLVKNPEEYEIKTFSIDGVKLDIFNSYRIFLNQNSKGKLTNANFIETIKPFLTFYKDLPDYSKNTKRLSKEALGIRRAISSSKDPEKTFFEDFPLALGFSEGSLISSKENLQKFIVKLQISIREIRSSYDELINRIEQFIQTEILGKISDFDEYKDELKKRYKNLKRHLLLPNQKIFIQRLDSQIEDKKSWLNSLIKALINTSLDKIIDGDEVIIYDKFKEMILELDSLTILTNSDFNEEKEEIFDLQIHSIFEGVSKKIIRTPKNKNQEVISIQESLRKQLSSDKSLNIAALTSLLKELIK